MTTPIDQMMNAVKWEPVEMPPQARDLGVPYATHTGTLEIGPLKIRCYQLSDGRRIVDSDDVHRFFGWPIGDENADQA